MGTKSARSFVRVAASRGVIRFVAATSLAATVVAGTGCYLSHERSEPLPNEPDASLIADAAVPPDGLVRVDGAIDAGIEADAAIVVPAIAPETRCVVRSSTRVTTAAATSAPVNVMFGGGGYGTGFAPDGTRLLFHTYSTDFAREDADGLFDVFVADLEDGRFQFVSAPYEGLTGERGFSFATFSPDGQSVLFVSDGSNLVYGDAVRSPQVFVKRLDTGELIPFSFPDPRWTVAAIPALSPDGTKAVLAVYVGVDRGHSQIVVLDLVSAAVMPVSVAPDGTFGNGTSELPSFSPDGTKVLFNSWASDLVPSDSNGASDVFLHDLSTGTTTRISVASDGSQIRGGCGDALLSPDGTKVVFASRSPDLAPGDQNGFGDLFLKDLRTGVVTRISVAVDGIEGTGESFWPQFSPDSDRVAFVSTASNWLPGDDNEVSDVFIKDLETGDLVRVSDTENGEAGNGASYAPFFSPGGTMLMFTSEANDLVFGDRNERGDVFVVCVD